MTTYHKTNNSSTIGPDELLTVRFPDLKENQVIIPETMKLTFNISLSDEKLQPDWGKIAKSQGYLILTSFDLNKI